MIRTAPLPPSARLVPNAISLVATTAATSGLGAAYWWLAARSLPQATVGLASATVSAKLLLSTLAMLGLGTWLTGALPRRSGPAGPPVAFALVVSGAAGGLLGLLFALCAPVVSAPYAPLQPPAVALFFALGVAVSAAVFVLDQAVIGLLRGDLQLWRNTAAAILKLLALVYVIRTGSATALAIYGTWVFGNVVSLAAFAVLARQSGLSLAVRPDWTLAGRLGEPLRHHALTMALQGPSLALPVLVAAIVSSGANASFYTAWMVAGFALVVPQALTTVLFAVQAADAAALASRLRRTLLLSVAAGLASALVLAAASGPILSFFGRGYAEQGAASLRLLGLLVFPYILKTHFVAVARIQGWIGRAARWTAGLGLLELSMAAAGGAAAGLEGLTIGLLLAALLGCAVTAGPVRAAATGGTA
ncbi:MAG TPA: hypothetical protein VHN99_04580 [Deinococcales bacterium]|nr:hypothetical protein [Deinococcales bacterium]